MCLCPEAKREYFARYQRAIAAASRVVVYRSDQWNSLHGGEITWLPSRDNFGRRAGLEAATCTAAENDAVSLCAEFRAKSAQRVGIMVFSDGPPGGAVWNASSADVDVVDDVGGYTTHESAVVSAWLRGECPAGPAGADAHGGRADRIRRHFQATIASRWSSSARSNEYDMHGDVWVVRDAVLDTTRYGPRNAKSSASDLQSAEAIPPNLTNVTNVTLVFVNVRWDASGAGRSQNVSVRSGLDAMIVEGVSVAIVAVDAVGAVGAQLIVNRALAERPVEPKSHEGEQALDIISDISDMQAGEDDIRGRYNLVDARHVQEHKESPVPLHATIMSYNTGVSRGRLHLPLQEMLERSEEESTLSSRHSAPLATKPLPVDENTRGHYFSAVCIAPQVNPRPTQEAHHHGQGRTRQGYAQQGYPRQGFPQVHRLVFGSSTRAASRFV